MVDGFFQEGNRVHPGRWVGRRLPLGHLAAPSGALPRSPQKAQEPGRVGWAGAL